MKSILPMAIFAATTFSLGLADLQGQQVQQTQQWHQFRGPESNGHAVAENLPVDFNDETNCDWKVSISGQAWSSPVIADDQIWLTNAIPIRAEGKERASRMKNAPAGGASAYSQVKLFAMCFDRKSGEQLHNILLYEVNDPPLINELNSFASPTPVIAGDHLICSFGSMGTVCLNRKDGSEVWREKDHQVDHQMGPGSSPYLYGDQLLVNFDGIDQQYIVSWDQQTGEDIWQTRRSGKLNGRPDMRKAYSTPIVAEIAGQSQVISQGADWVYGYDPADGKELWKISYGALGFSNAPQPIVVGDMIYICTGYMKSQLIAIKADSQKLTDENVVWRWDKQVPAMSTPVVVDDNIYFYGDDGIATCLDRNTGDKKWA